MCTCWWRRVTAARSQTPASPRRTNPQPWRLFSHVRPHPPTRSAGELNARRCVDLVTQRRGQMFEVALRREAVTGWENARCCQPFSHSTVIRTLPVSPRFVQICVLKCPDNKFDYQTQAVPRSQRVYGCVSLGARLAAVGPKIISLCLMGFLTIQKMFSVQNNSPSLSLQFTARTLFLFYNSRFSFLHPLKLCWIFCDLFPTIIQAVFLQWLERFSSFFCLFWTAPHRTFNHQIREKPAKFALKWTVNLALLVKTTVQFQASFSPSVKHCKWPAAQSQLRLISIKLESLG